MKSLRAKATAIIFCILMIASAMLMPTIVEPVQAQLTNVQEGDSVALPVGVTPAETYPTLARFSLPTSARRAWSAPVG